MSDFTLADLEKRIAERSIVDDGSSYTASLIAKGIEKASQKLGEEAIETIIAAVSGDKKEVILESADLLYHLFVVWRITGVDLTDVLNELKKRTAKTGLEEKAERRA